MPHNDDETARAIKQAAHNQWRHDKREERLAYERAYHAKHKEKRNEQQRQTYAKLSPETKAERIARQNQWTKDHPEARKEIQRRYRERNKEKIARAGREYTTNPEVKRRITDRKAATLEVLAGRPRPEVCEICANPPDEGRSLHYDHCHQTGVFRGWICRECNLILGHAHDDPARLRKLISYLEDFTQHNTIIG